MRALKNSCAHTLGYVDVIDGLRPVRAVAHNRDEPEHAKRGQEGRDRGKNMRPRMKGSGSKTMRGKLQTRMDQEHVTERTGSAANERVCFHRLHEFKKKEERKKVAENANISVINLVSIFRCSSSKTNSVYARRVNSLVLGCSLS
jgi:hypothetical protein